MSLKKKEKKVSFDAMVKFFIQHYGIPTRKDLDKLIAKIDNLEKIVKATQRRGGSGKGRRSARTGDAETAMDQVYNVIRKSKTGASFADIQAATGFKDKKIRNVIFRLNKLEKISRVSRGVYTIAR